MYHRAIIVSIVTAMLCALVTTAAAATDIYMRPAPLGNDANGGLSPKTPVETLQGVKRVAAAITVGDIDVQIFPATYHRQSVLWDNPIVARQIITFRPWLGTSGRPRFVGPGIAPGSSPSVAHNRAFFTLATSSSVGVASNLRFWHLHIEAYKDGILLSGKVNDVNGWNGRNQIIDVHFLRIGSKWAGDRGAIGYKALGLTNSRNNIIRYNYFEHIENQGDTAPLIHGIYMAHWSSHNNIRFNYFAYNSGDAIKTRDQSSNNVIRNNVFWRSGTKGAIVGDWYRNPKKVSSQRTRAKWERFGNRWECPSFANDVRGNNYGKDYAGTAELPPVAAVRPENDPNYHGPRFDPHGWSYDCPLRGYRFLTARNNYKNDWAAIATILSAWRAPGQPMTVWRAARGIEQRREHALMKVAPGGVYKWGWEWEWSPMMNGCGFMMKPEKAAGLWGMRCAVSRYVFIPSL